MIFEEVVEKLVNEVSGGIAALIMGRDGISLSTHCLEGQDMDIETLGIEYANLLAEIGRASDTMGSGEIHEITLLTDIYCTVLRTINPEYFIALIMNPEGNQGKAKFMMRISAPQILKEM